ncbi:anoctamin-8-like isoform X2 [Ornithodoros turicata]|uniref:anoctamin-8-like isoform X2 n=1 Tax=Ornithodoros turicata TaxID=34597 RepID=UPI00313A02E8
MEPKLRKRRKATRFSLSAAGHLIGRRWQVSKQFLAAAQYWHRMVPSQDCDVVLTFPAHVQDDTVDWFSKQFQQRVPQLVVDIRFHSHSGSHAFYFTANYDSLLHGAEELKLRKLLKEEFGGGYREFLYEEQACFQGVDDSGSFFSSQERQSIIVYLLNSLRATRGEALHNTRFVEGQSIVQRCLSEGIVEQILPLHDKHNLDKLRKSWVQAFFQCQPLDSICDYFGVKIAIYFAWLGHYTSALTFPALVGFLLWAFCYEQQADVCFVLFALMNALWATLYLESWKRYCAELAYHWGTIDSQSQLLTEPRPLFTGPLGPSPVTGRLEPAYPSWKRHLFRYLITVPVIVFCLSLVFMVMFLIFQLQVNVPLFMSRYSLNMFQTWWDNCISRLQYPFWLSYGPKVLLALTISVLDGFYQRIAIWLNDQENYRLDEDYENQLIIKIAVFQFVNSFLSLFYIAFYLQDMDKLKEQLAALLITRQVIGNIKESLVPFLTEHFNLVRICAATPVKRSSKRFREEDSSNGDGHLTQGQVECAMYKYEGTFEDYLEMFIQFGYVVLFSPAFPVAALCALLNNIIEVRSDAFKLCMIFQRPFGQRAENIGTWQDAMEVMGVIAVIVNCALIGTSGQMQRLFPSLTWGSTVLLIVIIEHVILFLKFAIAYAIPDIPQWVATEMAKIEYHRREAAKSLQSVRHHDKRTSTVGLSTTDLGTVKQVAASQTSPIHIIQEQEGSIKQPTAREDEATPSSVVAKHRSRASSLTSWASGFKSLRFRRIADRARSAEGGRQLMTDGITKSKQNSLAEA